MVGSVGSVGRKLRFLNKGDGYMEGTKFEQLESNLSAEIERRATTLERKLEAQILAAREVERMKAEGEAHEISDEEVRMIRALRRFKARCKPGGVFKWQTRPIEGVTIHEDTSLIQDPQEVI
jgi:hypothetical protein